MCRFYCINFIKYMIAGKSLLDYTNLLLLTAIKKMTRQYVGRLKTYIAKENGSSNFRLKEKDKTIKRLLKEIKHNDLMSEKHKKVFRTLKYFEHFLVFCFCCQWLCFILCICLIIWCSCRYRKFCRRN